MEKVEVKFGIWIEDGFNLYKDNFGPLVLASLIAMLLSWATLGILLGPMMAGLAIIALELVDRKQPQPSGGEVFRGFDYFLNSFLFFLVWGLMVGFGSLILFLIPCIGMIAGMFLVYGAQAFLMFALFLIVDRKRDFWPASMESINIVKTNFWPFLGVSIIAGLIGSLGGIACGIGVIFTIPIQMCVLAIAYRDVFDGVRITVEPAEPPPIPEPPPEGPTQPESGSNSAKAGEK
jgi:uncharacterized membrane protein